MKFLAFVLAALAVAFASASDIDESAVLVLSSTNFTSALAANPNMMVEFYAPWCGHCKALAPEYAKAAKTLEGEVALAKVDCTIEKDLCSEHKVGGFPTVYFFQEGKKLDYQSQRTADAIVSYIRKKTGPPAVTVTSKNVDLFPTFDNVVVLGLFDKEGSEEESLYIDLATSLREDSYFGITHDKEVASKYKVTSFPAILLIADFAKEPVVYSGEWKKAAVSKWIKEESFPILGEISPENYKKYVDRSLPLAWVFVDGKEFENKESLGENLALVEKVLKDLPKGKFSAVYLDGEKYARHRNGLGHEGELPGLLVIQDSDGKKFKFPENVPFTEESVKTFLSGYIDGKLEPFLKSEEVPEKNDEPVKVVVGKTFDDIVLDSTKDVLVEFYAPWCGHCKSLAPIYDSLAEKFADKEDVVIAKIDATANDTPENVQGFPTLVFYPKNKANKVNYEGDRTLEDLTTFVEKHAESLKTAETKVDEKKTVKDEL